MPSWRKVIVSGSDASLNSLIVSNNLTVSGSTRLGNGSDPTYINNYRMPLADGTVKQIMITDGAGNVAFDFNRTLYEEVKNVSGGTLQKGTPVHVVSTIGNTNNVIAASASLASTMPVTFILDQTLADDEEGLGIILGHINGVNTSAFNEGDIVYVGPNGGYTNVKPTGSNLIQPLGLVIKVDASNGSGLVMNPGVTNDTPNLLNGQIFWGENNVAIQKPLRDIISGSAYAYSGSFTGSLLGTASYATQALSSSYAVTASYALNGGGGGGGITGTGTAGQVTYWSGTSVVTGSSNFFYDSGNKTLFFISTSGVPSIAVKSQQASGYAPSFINLTRVGATDNATPNNSGIGQIRFDGLDSNNNYANFALIEAAIGTNAAGGAPAYLAFNTADSGTSTLERMRINNSGNVSIGTTSSSGRLTVRGPGTTSATTALLVQNSTPTNLLQILDNGRINQTIPGSSGTTIFGTNAGYSNTTGVNNSYFGVAAGQNNTTGNANSFFGQAAGLNQTTGDANTFIGSSAGRNTTIGSYNTFCGIDVGYNNTTGGANSFFGVTAGYNNTTGTYNSFFGVDAGRYLNSGADLTVSSNSVFIGVDTRANGNSETNQIVIGYQGRGLGSNTTVIGNTSTTQTHLHGGLTLGPTTSGARLQYAENTDVDTGTETVMTIATGSYRCAFFDYVVTKSTNARSGTVMVVWNGTSIDFTETSTNDIGTTSDLTLRASLSGGNILLQATALSNDWSVKTLARLI